MIVSEIDVGRADRQSSCGTLSEFMCSVPASCAVNLGLIGWEYWLG